MFKHIPTLILVTLVTVLIWAFAEAETLRTRSVQIELVFQPDATGDEVVDIRNDSAILNPNGTITLRPTLTLEGSSAAVDDLEAALRRPLKFGPYAEGLKREPGQHFVPLREVLRAMPEFKNVGVTITDTSPPDLFVFVDTLVNKDVPIRVQLPTGEAEGVPEVSPARAILRVPSGDVGRIAPDAYVNATPETQAVERLLPGRRETLRDVKLSLPDPARWPKGMQVTPKSAEVALTLRSRTPTSKPLTAPVQVVLAAVEQAKWDVALEPADQFITDVTVTGPPEVIRQIDAKQIAVVALLPLSFQELEGGRVTSKDVAFATLPPVSAALRFESPRKTVAFTVQKRAANPAPRPGN